jgi:hypothetical protein
MHRKFSINLPTCTTNGEDLLVFGFEEPDHLRQKVQFTYIDRTAYLSTLYNRIHLVKGLWGYQ